MLTLCDNRRRLGNMARTKVRRIGNSRGIVIPADMIEDLGLEAGDEVDLAKDADRLVMRVVDSDRPSFIEAMEGVLREDAKIIEELAKV